MTETDWDAFFNRVTIETQCAKTAVGKKNIGLRMAGFIIREWMPDNDIKERAIAVLKEVAKVQ